MITVIMIKEQNLSVCIHASHTIIVRNFCPQIYGLRKLQLDLGYLNND